MNIEAAVLTGGRSRRMGRDKATLPVDGVPQAERVVRALLELGIPVTTLGREPTPGAAFLADDAEYAGPVRALARFTPTREQVFVCSCDLPRFDARLVPLLALKLRGDAAVPFVDGFRQPLCALYRSSAFDRLREIADSDNQCAMSWLNALDVTEVSEAELLAGGVDPAATRGANTPQELERLLNE